MTRLQLRTRVHMLARISACRASNGGLPTALSETLGISAAPRAHGQRVGERDRLRVLPVQSLRETSEEPRTQILRALDQLAELDTVLRFEVTAGEIFCSGKGDERRLAFRVQGCNCVLQRGRQRPESPSVLLRSSRSCPALRLRWLDEPDSRSRWSTARAHWRNPVTPAQKNQ